MGVYVLVYVFESLENHCFNDRGGDPEGLLAYVYGVDVDGGTGKAPLDVEWDGAGMEIGVGRTD